MVIYWLLAGIVAFTTAPHAFAADDEPDRLPSIIIQKEAHFTGRDGSDIRVKSGGYSINVGDGQQLWLTSETTREAWELDVDKMSHDMELGSDVTLLIPGEEDRVHLVVLFEDKSALTAVGFPNAARPRGTGIIRVNPSVLRESAAIFAKPAAPPATPPQVLPGAPGKSPTTQSIPSHPTSVQVGPPKWLTWSFLRINEPQAVTKILADVQAGKLPPATLNGLAPPAALTEMMKTNWAAETARLEALHARPTEPAGPMTSSAGGIRSRGLFGTGGSAFANPAGIARFGQAPPLVARAFRNVAVDQSLVDFGGMYYGQIRRRQIDLTVSKDGEVTVTAPADSAYRILSLSSYTGGFTPVTRAPSASGPLAAATTRFDLVAEVDKQRTAAPFRLPVRAGQGLSVMLEFVPTKEGGVKEGAYQSALLIDSTLFDQGHAMPEQTTVPIRAQINGFLFGADANPVNGNASTLPQQDFIIEFDFTNEGQPSEALLEITNLPAGFTSNIPSIRMSLAKGERRRAGFLMRASAAARGPGGAPEEKWITFKFTNGPNAYTLDYPVYLYPAWVRYPFRATVPFSNGGALSTEGTLDVRGDGWFNFQGKLDPSAVFARLNWGLNDDMTDRWLVGFVLNHGGYTQEVIDFHQGWSYHREGTVRELAQDYVKTIDAGFRILLSGSVRIN